MPHHFGFQRWFGHLRLHRLLLPPVHYMQARHTRYDLWETGRRSGATVSMTDMITQRSVDIRERARDSERFFLYTAYNAPHYPMHAPEEYVARFDHLPGTSASWRR